MIQIANRLIMRVRTLFFRMKYRAFDSFGDAVFVANPQGTILYCNPIMSALFGKATKEIIGSKCWEIVHKTNQPDQSCILAKMKKSLRREKTGLTMDNRHFEIICDPVLKNGELKEVLHSLVDITRYINQKQALKQLASNDSLTGLFNRRYLGVSLERLLKRSEREHAPIGAIMLDMDRFKRYNDNFGHDAGDVLLVELGKLLMEKVRPGDIACRYGGEEFLLILPGASKEIARQRAEEVLKAVRRLDLHHRNNHLGRVTISAGVASFPEDGETAADLIYAADQALLRAKREGRNRVAVAE